MDILNLIETTTHIEYRKKASTRGGEFSGPCPWCSGNDRFSIHPAEEHYVCRQCKKAGDAIKFLIEYENISFRQAVKKAREFGFTPKKNYTGRQRYSSEKNIIAQWEPRSDSMPDLTWQTKAQAFLFECYKFLLSSNPEAQTHRRWLNARGISNNLIKTARLGWNFRSVTFSRESWGLTPELSKNGKNKQIWIPAGLMIPYFTNGKLIRLRIRQENPKTTDRFIMVPGSSMDYFNHASADPASADMGKKASVIVVEAELDGWLLHDQTKKAGLESQIRIFSIGNSTTRPNRLAHEIIGRAPQVHACLDNDDAGDVETRWWQNKYTAARDSRIPIQYGKDPGEAFQNHFDFAGWFAGFNQDLKNQNQNHQDKKPGTSFFDQVIEADPDKELDKKMRDSDQKSDHGQKLNQGQEQDQEENLISNSTSAPTSKIANIIVDDTKACVHGHICMSAKNGRCLITKQSIWQMDKCPREQWYSVRGPGYRQIIYGVGFKAV